MSLTTKSYHESYPAISPTRPELSYAGKTVVLSGAGAGIGRNTVLELAKAGAPIIHIIGRTPKTLKETKSIVEAKVPSVKIVAHTGSIADAEAMHRVAKEVGPWDVYIANAGLFPAKATTATANVSTWWSGYETNVKGSLIQYQAFLPTHKPGAAIVAYSTAAIMFPVQNPILAGGSSYTSSKLAGTKLWEYIAVENDPSDLQVVIIHPGIIKTDMAILAEVPDEVEADDINLASHFTMWAGTKEANFAHGKFLFCNWDVDELKAMKEKFAEPDFLTVGGLKF